jgi:hypothetical protein
MELWHSTKVQKAFFNWDFSDTDTISGISFLTPYICLLVLSNNWEVSSVFSNLFNNTHPLNAHTSGSEYKATNSKSSFYNEILSNSPHVEHALCFACRSYLLWTSSHFCPERRSEAAGCMVETLFPVVLCLKHDHTAVLWSGMMSRGTSVPLFSFQDIPFCLVSN